MLVAPEVSAEASASPTTPEPETQNNRSRPNPAEYEPHDTTDRPAGPSRAHQRANPVPADASGLSNTAGYSSPTIATVTAAGLVSFALLGQPDSRRWWLNVVLAGDRSP